KADDEIRKIAQKNPCLKRLIRNATTETRSSNFQLQSAIKRWRKSFNEGTAPDDIQESWNRDNLDMSKKERSPSGWMATANNLLKDACDMARRIILPPPVGRVRQMICHAADNPSDRGCTRKIPLVTATRSMSDLAHFADSSRTSPEVGEVPIADMGIRDTSRRP